MSEIWLSRLRLNPRNRDVQRDLSDCHRLHRLVMSGFPNDAGSDARAAFGVLYRPEADPRTGVVTLIVQSARPPTWDFPVLDGERESYLAPLGRPPEVSKPIGASYAAIRDGRTLRFRLRANPTKRLGRGTGEGPPDRLAGKRVGLLREDQQHGWAERRLGDGGAALLRVEIRPDLALGNPQVGLRAEVGADGPRRGVRLTFQAVRFDGVLRVVDAERFRTALAVGIGSGKAYGFGLLSVATYQE